MILRRAHTQDELINQLLMASNLLCKREYLSHYIMYISHECTDASCGIELKSFWIRELSALILQDDNSNNKEEREIIKKLPSPLSGVKTTYESTSC